MKFLFFLLLQYDHFCVCNFRFRLVKRNALRELHCLHQFLLRLHLLQLIFAKTYREIFSLPCRVVVAINHHAKNLHCIHLSSTSPQFLAFQFLFLKKQYQKYQDYNLLIFLTLRICRADEPHSIRD